MEESKQIRKAFRRIAEAGIPDDVNLWPRIEARIRQQPRHSLMPFKRRWSLASAAVILSSLIFAAGAYALSRFPGFIPDFDPGMQQIQQDNLGIDLGISQTIDGITVTVDHVYADANRVVIYTTASATGIAAPDSINMVARLLDSRGYVFEPIFGGGGGGGGGSADGEPVKSGWTVHSSHNFDASIIEGDPDVVSLRFELTLNPDGRFESESASAGPFVFDITAPFVPAVVVEPAQTITAGKLPMTLEWASVTPSSTRVRLCFPVNHPENVWTPVASLDTGEQAVPDLGYLHLKPRSETNGSRRCVELDFLAPYDRRPTQRTLVVERMQNAPDLDGPWVFTFAIP